MKKEDSGGADWGDVIVGCLAESDVAYPIIMSILRVVPASRWAFARLKPDGELAGLLADPQGTGGDLQALRSEFARQRATVKTGSRIAAMLSPGQTHDAPGGRQPLLELSRPTQPTAIIMDRATKGTKYGPWSWNWALRRSCRRKRIA